MAFGYRIDAAVKRSLGLSIVLLARATKDLPWQRVASIGNKASRVCPKTKGTARALPYLSYGTGRSAWARHGRSLIKPVTDADDKLTIVKLLYQQTLDRNTTSHGDCPDHPNHAPPNPLFHFSAKFHPLWLNFA
jgi:hypothetical protein